MSSYSIIADVTQTLKHILDSRKSTPQNFEVSLHLPAADAQALDDPTNQQMTSKINLYLFLLEENETAKNQNWAPQGPNALAKPPLTLNLYYVMTPLAEMLLDEHRILGEAMRIFYDYSVIPREDFQGELAQLTDDLRIDLCPFNIEELTRIWNAFNQPYRLSVCYRVRIVSIDSAIEREVTRVLSKEGDYGFRQP